MAMSLSSGGGMGGGGMGAVAMAHQFNANGMPGNGSAPPLTVNEGVSTMGKLAASAKSDQSDKTAARLKLPIACLDAYNAEVSYAKPGAKLDLSVGTAITDKSTLAGCLPDAFTHPITIVRNNIDSYKALRRYARKGHSPQAVFDACTPRSSKDVVSLPLDAFGLCRSLASGSYKGEGRHLSLSAEERATLVVDVHDDYEPIALRPDRILGLYIHAAVGKRVPGAVEVGCIVNVPVMPREGDEFRTWVKLGLGCTDFYTACCPSLKKREEAGWSQPDALVASVAGSLYSVTRGGGGRPR
mmetsp:Transcript_5345/g.11263  ORF Transcript_5345/g.11263 Transcript_5345/m.11263 type:complete len:299 (-) Transcript_5345:9-905(-)